MQILALSDKIIPWIYSPQIRQHYSSIDLILGCGDLPYYYLEYVVSMLDVPLYFVRGNHDSVIEHTVTGQRQAPRGAIDIHRNHANHDSVILAGIEGCLRYRVGHFQYSQSEFWFLAFSLIPGLMLNRVRFGRYLDIFITHAPPWGINDQADRPHQGIKAFRWLVKIFKPAYHLHGHIHVYKPTIDTGSIFHQTRVLNVYGHRMIKIDLDTDITNRAGG